MLNVEAEVSKYKNIKDRDELGRVIQSYKSNAIQHANDIFMAGQYDMVAHKLQVFYDKLPAPHIKNTAVHSQATPSKTAKISKEEKAQISAAWKKKTGG